MAEKSRTFAVKPTRIMLLMSEKGTANIRKIYFAFSDLHLSSIELDGDTVMAVDHDIEDLEAILKVEEENGLVQHILPGEVLFLPNEEVKLLFHTLWTKARSADDYDKKQWMQLDRILRERGYEL